MVSPTVTVLVLFQVESMSVPLARMTFFSMLAPLVLFMATVEVPSAPSPALMVDLLPSIFTKTENGV